MQHPWFADMNTRMKTIPYKPKLTPSALSPRLMDRASEKLKEPSITIRERGQGATPREKGFTPREMPWIAKESPRSPRERERAAMSPKEKGSSASASPSPKGRENDPLLVSREKKGNEAVDVPAAVFAVDVPVPVPAAVPVPVPAAVPAVDVPVPVPVPAAVGSAKEEKKENNPSAVMNPTEEKGTEASAAIPKEEKTADVASGPLANKHQSSLEVNASDSPRSPVDM